MPATRPHRPSGAGHFAFHDSRVRQVRGLHVGPLAARCKRSLQAAHVTEAYGHPTRPIDRHQPNSPASARVLARQSEAQCSVVENEAQVLPVQNLDGGGSLCRLEESCANDARARQYHHHFAWTEA